MPNKILIIKLGYSETLDQEISTTTSLGDVLRTTVILNYFKKDEITWLVDEKAHLLLEGNPFIKRIVVFSQKTILQLQRERFDIIINLEKGPGICEFSDSVKAKKRFGFWFDPKKGSAQAYDGAELVLSLCLDRQKKKRSIRFWQDALSSMIAKKWSPRKEYILGYRPSSKVKYDIGFNWVVGDKWPNKAWPKKNWKKLEKLLKKQYNISWQRGLGDLAEYMDWINSCRLIVTNDSLGMHLAIALKKKLIVLFGPSSSKEVYLYGRGVKLVGKVPYKCLPCLSPVCIQPVSCMEYITPEQVQAQIIRSIPQQRKYNGRYF